MSMTSDTITIFNVFGWGKSTRNLSDFPSYRILTTNQIFLRKRLFLFLF